jgi:hypothetical protein
VTSVFGWLADNSQAIDQLASALQAAAAVVALIVGGVWTYLLFVRNRLGKPAARTAHQVTIKDLGDCGYLVRVGVIVENLSTVLIRIKSGKVRLKRILPLSEELSGQLVHHECPLVEGGKVKWPLLANRPFDWTKTYQVEPHESDTLYFDFVVDKPLTTFEVYSHIFNVSKVEGTIGWNTTTVHDVPERDGREGLLPALDAVVDTVRNAIHGGPHAAGQTAEAEKG